MKVHNWHGHWYLAKEPIGLGDFVIISKRSWFERLFDLPWYPWVKYSVRNIRVD